jgi:diguanylate cyclase (GGDEF)-like protein
MSSESATPVAFAGQRLRRKVLCALVLSSVLPLLMLAYVVHVYTLTDRGPHADGPAVVGVSLLAVLAMLGGGWIIHDLGRTMARLGGVLGEQRTAAALAGPRDDADALFLSLARMGETIEGQAREIEAFAGRLDGAHRELELTNARLRETSFKDEVTGLYTRRFFSLRLEEEMSRYRRFHHPVAVVLLDLDGFKTVNDDLGHAVGDETLREVAVTLARHSRGINVTARWGGDEFAVLLVETSKEGALLYADRIRQFIAGRSFLHGKPVTASFGVAALPDDEAASGDELVRAADAALFAAKRAGRNQVAGASAGAVGAPAGADGAPRS